MKPDWERRRLRETAPHAMAGQDDVQGRARATQAPAEAQLPQPSAAWQHAEAGRSQMSSENVSHSARDFPLQGRASFTASGMRPSTEAQRAMSQLAAQRTALVLALQNRARGATWADETPGTAGQEIPQGGPQTRQEDANEEVVWYSRLQGCLRAGSWNRFENT